MGPSGDVDKGALAAPACQVACEVARDNSIYHVVSLSCLCANQSIRSMHAAAVPHIAHAWRT
jgi:hypothetical protein